MCKCVTVLHTTDHFENTTLNNAKAPWGWHPWNAETFRRRFGASAVYIFQCMWGWFYKADENYCTFWTPSALYCHLSISNMISGSRETPQWMVPRAVRIQRAHTSLLYNCYYILPSTTRSLKMALFFRFSYSNVACISHISNEFHMFAHLIRLRFVPY